MEAVATIRSVAQFSRLYAVTCSQKDVVEYYYYHIIYIITIEGLGQGGSEF